MKKYKITYIEGDTINKVETIEAESEYNALILFLIEKSNIKDVTKVEEVEE